MAADDNGSGKDRKMGGSSSSGAPEPPPSWKPTGNAPNNTQGNEREYSESEQPGKPESPLGKPPDNPTQYEGMLVDSARRLISISQICAIVSLFLGGILLSSVALVLAIAGLVKLNALANERNYDQSAKSAIRKPGMAAVAMSVFALVLNIVSLVYLYPLVMQALQSGDITSIFGIGQGSGAVTGSGSSTWG